MSPGFSRDKAQARTPLNLVQQCLCPALLCSKVAITNAYSAHCLTLGMLPGKAEAAVLFLEEALIKESGEKKESEKLGWPIFVWPLLQTLLCTIQCAVILIQK